MPDNNDLCTASYELGSLLSANPMPLQSNSSWRCVSRHSRKRINDKKCLVHHFRYCELPRSCRCSSANSHKFTKVRKSDSSLRHKRCFSAAACCFSRSEERRV